MRMLKSLGRSLIVALAVVASSHANAEPFGSALSTDGATSRMSASDSGGGNASWDTATIVAAAATAPEGMAVEYYSSILGHYFLTAFPEEAAALDVGQGWSRTGFSFPVYLDASAGALPVCRFYSIT